MNEYSENVHLPIWEGGRLRYLVPRLDRVLPILVVRVTDVHEVRVVVGAEKEGEMCDGQMQSENRRAKNTEVEATVFAQFSFEKKPVKASLVLSTRYRFLK
jgi:hypothetical protein